MVFTCIYLLSLSVVAGKLNVFNPEDACFVVGLVVDVATCTGNVVAEMVAGTLDDILCKEASAVPNGTLKKTVAVNTGLRLDFSFPVRPGI